MAKPTPLPMGRANPHVLQSHGPENFIMNFYVTNYSTSFAKPNTDFDKSKFSDIPAYTGGQTFKPRSAPELKKTGFVSNVRPQFYYKESLDTYDNPTMRLICADNYESMTKKQFKPFIQPDGTEELPAHVSGLQESAFLNYHKIHNPRPDQVADLFIDTKYRSPFDILPKHVPLLNKLNNKDPIPKETFNNGVKYMSTEYDTRFENPDNDPRTNKHSLVGPKQSSGFVTNQENDTLTGLPGERWLYQTRPTGTTNYHDRFQPFAYPTGTESLPNLAGLQPSETGHTRSILPPTQVNPRSHTFGNPTEYDTHYLGIQRPAPNYAQNVNSAVVGPKEDTANTRNELPYIATYDDPRRFATDYQSKFFDKTPKDKDREGYVVGGVNGEKKSGFTKNTYVQDPGSFNPKSILDNVQSYQSRSVKGRDVYFDDSTHKHKFNVKFNNAQTTQDNNPNSVKISCT